MKYYFLTLILIIASFRFANAQSSYNQELEKAAKEIAQKIVISGKKSVAVLDFENSNKQVSELGSWLAGIFTTHLENNNANSFSVKNRTDIEKAIQQIKSENGSGAFDSKTIQRLGEISGSDVIIYGEITLLDNDITINIRTKNISLNATIGGVIVSFIATEGMRTKYDNITENKATSSNNIATSGYKPSGEGLSSTSKNPNCKELNIGNYCFQNNTNLNLTVIFRSRILESKNGGTSPSYNLQPGQKQCFYDVESGSIEYIIEETRKQGSYTVGSGVSTGYKVSIPYRDYAVNGSVYVETCKEKTFIIK
jgi:hypothetical protein